MVSKYLDNQGNEREGKLLLSGFWKWARHMNYTFEIIFAYSFSLVGIYQGFGCIFYASFLVPLLIHRIYRDEHKC